jgi:hypothetical protein
MKRRRITERENMGDGGEGGVGLATRLAPV